MFIFSYRSGPRDFKGINLNLPAGSFVSLVVNPDVVKVRLPNPCSKEPGYSGEDGIGSVPLNANESNLMQRVVLVRHNSYLFKGTVEKT